MWILFDQGTPVPLRRFLADHIVATAYERGWSCVTKCELMRLAEQEGSERLITTDTNLRVQQNLQGRSLACPATVPRTTGSGRMKCDQRTRRGSGAGGPDQNARWTEGPAWPSRIRGRS